MFIAGRLIIGMGVGFVQTALGTYVAQATTPKLRALFLASTSPVGPSPPYSRLGSHIESFDNSLNPLPSTQLFHFNSNRCEWPALAALYFYTIEALDSSELKYLL